MMTPKCILWQKVKTGMKCCIMQHFIRVSLHCLLRQKRSLEKEIQFYMEIYVTCDPLSRYIQWTIQLLYSIKADRKTHHYKGFKVSQTESSLSTCAYYLLRIKKLTYKISTWSLLIDNLSESFLKSYFYKKICR